MKPLRILQTIVVFATSVLAATIALSDQATHIEKPKLAVSIRAFDDGDPVTVDVALTNSTTERVTLTHVGVGAVGGMCQALNSPLVIGPGETEHVKAAMPRGNVRPLMPVFCSWVEQGRGPQSSLAQLSVEKGLTAERGSFSWAPNEIGADRVTRLSVFGGIKPELASVPDGFRAQLLNDGGTWRMTVCALQPGPAGAYRMSFKPQSGAFMPDIMLVRTSGLAPPRPGFQQIPAEQPKAAAAPASPRGQG